MSEVKSRAEVAEYRLHTLRAALARGRSSAFDLSEEDLAFTALEALVVVLRAGCPNQSTLDMLASFVEDLSMVKLPTKPAKRTATANLNIALRILGYPRTGGQLFRDYARQRAIASFELHAREGRTEEQALSHAYDEYWAAMQSKRTYAVDRKRSVGTTVGADEVASSAADRFVNGQLRRWLRTAGLIDKKKLGRKPVLIKKLGG